MVGKRISELRRDNHMTRKELAEKIGVSIATIKNWETESADPRIENIRCLASVFSVTTDYLLGHSNEYIICHKELEYDDIVLLNSIVQHIINTKHKK